jgi:hypothetical protein
MKRAVTLALLSTGAALASGAASADRGLAVSGGVGTTGGIVEGQAQITPHIQIRGGYNYFSYDVDDNYEDIDYSGDLDLSGLAAFLDVRPFANSFILTAGAYFGEKGLDLAADPSSTYTIDSQVYTSAEVGDLRLAADLEDTAPFVGLGWDTTFQGDGAFGWKLIAGAMFTGTPDVNLTSTGGTQSNNPLLLQAIADEEASLQDEVDDYEVYPVVQAGVTFRF